MFDEVEVVVVGVVLGRGEWHEAVDLSDSLTCCWTWAMSVSCCSAWMSSDTTVILSKASGGVWSDSFHRIYFTNVLYIMYTPSNSNSISIPIDLTTLSLSSCSVQKPPFFQPPPQPRVTSLVPPNCPWKTNEYGTANYATWRIPQLEVVFYANCVEEREERGGVRFETVFVFVFVI